MIKSCKFHPFPMKAKYIILPLGVDANKLTLSYIEKDPASGPKSHRCTICGKTGNDRSNLRRHVESVHFPESFQFDCKYCGKVYNAKNSLYVHISTYHRDQK